jgi:sortase (surface protein transpeptidase)
VRLSIPELDIDMKVDAMGFDPEGAMALPDAASDAGWYKFGPGVGHDSGATVIAAHIDSRHDGIGPFSRLKDASPGSIISVAGSDGVTVDYVVTEVRSVGKIDAPMRRCSSGPAIRGSPS